MARLMDLATVIRSRNAGPYEITFDIMFDDPEMYEQVKRTGIINRELSARLYHVRPEEVFFTTYDAAYAFKGTLPRRASAGDVEDTDVYGAQQHASLLTIEVPLEASEVRWRASLSSPRLAWEQRVPGCLIVRERLEPVPWPPATGWSSVRSCPDHR